MTRQIEEEKAYAFCLDNVRDGRFYYRTISLFSGSFADHGRDNRKAHPITVANFERIMVLLKQPLRWVRTDDEFAGWLASYGWALVPNQYAERRLGAFLDSRPCVKSAIGLFWDAALPRNRATSRRIPKLVREHIWDRDGHRCIECGARESDGAELTMDHVIPFSRGGETAEGNLVTLCKTCNQRYGNVYHPHLFVLAGLEHDWNPRLLDSGVASAPDARDFAVKLSQNMMVSFALFREKTYD